MALSMRLMVCAENLVTNFPIDFLGIDKICSQTTVLSFAPVSSAETKTLVGNFSFACEVLPEMQTKLNTDENLLHTSFEMQQHILFFANKELSLSSTSPRSIIYTSPLCIGVIVFFIVHFSFVNLNFKIHENLYN